VNYGLDAQNGLQTYTDPRSLVTSYVRNGFGEAIQEASPDSGTTVYVRDARGLVTQMTDARGVVTNFTYDNAGRTLTRKPVGAATENVTYTWDQITGGNKGKGRLTGISDESGSTAWKYDALGQIITDTRIMANNLYATSYSYAGGNRDSITYPSGRIVTFTRNALGQITSVTTKRNSAAPSENVATNIAYRPMSNLINLLNYGNGLSLAQSFTADYRANTIQVKDGATSIISLTYAYMDKINLTKITDVLNAANTVTLGYSPANRLTSAQGPWGILSWTYDGVGNRLTETLGATVDTTNYPATLNKPTNITRAGSTVRSWTYDAAGNVATDVRAADSYGYSYSKANRLASVTDLGSPGRAISITASTSSPRAR
jgi:YD repeat-containing protein